MPRLPNFPKAPAKSTTSRSNHDASIWTPAGSRTGLRSRSHQFAKSCRVQIQAPKAEAGLQVWLLVQVRLNPNRPSQFKFLGNQTLPWKHGLKTQNHDFPRSLHAGLQDSSQEALPPAFLVSTSAEHTAGRPCHRHGASELTRKLVRVKDICPFELLGFLTGAVVNTGL